MSDKRKHAEHGAVSDREKKAREDIVTEETAVKEEEEEEVEEFFAILRRIHVAMRYFKSVNVDGGDRKLMEEITKSKAQMLEDENTREIDGAERGGSKRLREGGEENPGFDLNADPDPEM